MRQLQSKTNIVKTLIITILVIVLVALSILKAFGQTKNCQQL